MLLTWSVVLYAILSFSGLAIPNVPPNGVATSDFSGATSSTIVSRAANVLYRPLAILRPVPAIFASGPTHLGVSVKRETSRSSGPFTGGAWVVLVGLRGTFWGVVYGTFGATNFTILETKGGVPV